MTTFVVVEVHTVLESQVETVWEERVQRLIKRERDGGLGKRNDRERRSGVGWSCGAGRRT